MSKTSGANYHSSIISGAFWNNQWSTRVSSTSGFSPVCVSSTNHVSSNLFPFKWSLDTLVIGNHRLCYPLKYVECWLGTIQDVVGIFLGGRGHKLAKFLTDSSKELPKEEGRGQKSLHFDDILNEGTLNDAMNIILGEQERDNKWKVCT